MANLNNHASRFRKGLSNPFSDCTGAGGNAFATLGTEWCSRCQMAVDCDTQAEHQGTTYGYKRWCLRCGKVVKFGLYENVPLLSGGVTLQPVALEWATRPGQDRR